MLHRILLLLLLRAHVCRDDDDEFALLDARDVPTRAHAQQTEKVHFAIRLSAPSFFLKVILAAIRKAECRGRRRRPPAPARRSSIGSLKQSDFW